MSKNKPTKDPSFNSSLQIDRQNGSSPMFKAEEKQNYKDLQDFVNKNRAFPQKFGSQTVSSFIPGRRTPPKKRTQEEKIFDELCPVDQYQKENICIKCGEKFGLFKSSYNCAFCGVNVCSEHSQKERANPQNKKEFKRICDICDMRYLNKRVNEHYQREKAKRDKVIKEQENYLNCKKLKYAEKENQLNSMKLQMEKKVLSSNDKLREIAMEIKDRRIQTERIKSETELTNENIRKVSEKSKELQTKVREQQATNRKLKEQEEELDHELKEIEYRIISLRNFIDPTEEKIRQYNIYKRNPNIMREKELASTNSSDHINPLKRSEDDAYLKSIINSATGSLKIDFASSFNKIGHKKEQKMIIEDKPCCGIF